MAYSNAEPLLWGRVSPRCREIRHTHCLLTERLIPLWKNCSINCVSYLLEGVGREASVAEQPDCLFIPFQYVPFLLHPLFLPAPDSYTMQQKWAAHGIYCDKSGTTGYQASIQPNPNAADELILKYWYSPSFMPHVKPRLVDLLHNFLISWNYTCGNTLHSLISQWLE